MRKGTTGRSAPGPGCTRGTGAGCGDILRFGLTTALSRVLAGVFVCACGWALAQEDGAAESSYEAGVSALREKDYAAAAAALEDAAHLRPDDAGIWLELGIAYAAQKNWEDAIRAYRKVVELDPTDARAHHNLGNVYFRKGDFETAIEAYDRALKLDPDYIVCLFHLGWTLRQLNRAEPAEAAFEHCLALPAVDAQKAKVRVDCLFGLGSMRHRAGDYVAAAAMMEQVLAVHPAHLEARYYLALAYRQLGRADEARMHFRIHERMLAERRKSLGMAAAGHGH